MVANLHPPKRGPLCPCRFLLSACGDLRAIRRWSDHAQGNGLLTGVTTPFLHSAPLLARAPPPSPGCRRQPCCTSAGRGPSCGRGTAACRPNPRTTGSAENPHCRSGPPPRRRSDVITPSDFPSGGPCATAGVALLGVTLGGLHPLEAIVPGQQFVQRGNRGGCRAERFPHPRGDEPASHSRNSLACRATSSSASLPDALILAAAAASSPSPVPANRQDPSRRPATRSAPPAVAVVLRKSSTRCSPTKKAGGLFEVMAISSACKVDF